MRIHCVYGDSGCSAEVGGDVGVQTGIILLCMRKTVPPTPLNSGLLQHV